MWRLATQHNLLAAILNAVKFALVHFAAA